MKTLYTTFFTLLLCLSIPLQAQETLGEITQYITNLNSSNASDVYKSIKQLQSFSYTDFTENHKQQIANNLKVNQTHIDRLIELCGFLQMEEELLAYAQNKDLSKRIKQTLNLALVRAGNRKKIENLVKNLGSISVSDDYAYNLVPKLVQTRQKEVFDYLLKQVLDDNIICRHPDMETSGKFNCAFPILENIAPYIIDFPIKVNQFGIVSNNPNEALEISRKWIDENINSYSINKTIF